MHLAMYAGLYRAAFIQGMLLLNFNETLWGRDAL